MSPKSAKPVDAGVIFRAKDGGGFVPVSPTTFTASEMRLNADGDRFYVDAIRVGLGPDRIYTGDSARKFLLEQYLPKLERESLLSRDIARFSKLANGYVIPDPNRANVLIDIRYSMLPISIAPMWGIDLNVGSVSQHAKFEVYRDKPDNLRETFLAMLLGRDLQN